MSSESWEQLYNVYYMRVFSFVMTLAADRNLAEEITQEAFLKAMSKADSFRGEADEATWLCTIAKNCFTDEMRRRSKTEPIPEELPAEGKDLDENAQDKDFSFRIHVALHALEEPYREVFELRVFGELPFAQIGTIFEKTENWARVTYHRARLKLQERMREHDN